MPKSSIPSTFIRGAKVAFANGLKAVFNAQGFKTEQEYGPESHIGVNEYKIDKLKSGSCYYTNHIQYCTALLLKSRKEGVFGFAHLELLESDPDGTKTMSKMIKELPGDLASYRSIAYGVGHSSTTFPKLSKMMFENSEAALSIFVENGGDPAKWEEKHGSSPIVSTNGESIDECTMRNPAPSKGGGR